MLCTNQPLPAQEVSAGITGRITDPTGAAIVGATARDVDRGTVWPTQTNEEGIYAFPRIPVGNYDLKVEAKGFKTLTRPGITLELNQRARLDLTMELGAVTETVEVTGVAPLLNTDTTIVRSVLTSNSIINTPLITRNFIMLTLLTPGVTTTDPSAFNNGMRTSGGGRPYVNGNRKEANNFLLDGIDNNLTSDNLTSYQPNLDAIQEVKMITNNASAEFGNFQGGVINVNLKSGTNEFHGNVFEFFRNDMLNANNWTRNWQLQLSPPIPTRAPPGFPRRTYLHCGARPGLAPPSVLCYWEGFQGQATASTRKQRLARRCLSPIFERGYEPPKFGPRPGPPTRRGIPGLCSLSPKWAMGVQ
jgi:hypothetical protein